MTDWKHDLAILSDLSANIFAVFILVLIMLLQAEQTTGRPKPPSVIEATTDLAAVERAPLSAGSVIGQLYDRRTSADGASIDLFTDCIVVARGSDEVVLPVAVDQPVAARLAGLMRTVPAAQPVRLYVFDHRNYVAVADLLSGEGRVWREMSVPQALRGKGGEAWSDAFVQLIARPLDPSRFRYALARLLEGAGEGLSASGSGKGATPAQPVAPSLVNRLTRFAAWLGTAFAVVMIMTALAVVALIEWRWPRSRRFLRRSPL